MNRYKNDPYTTKARFASTCPICGLRVKKGDDITVWPRADKGKKARHWECSESDYNQFRAAALDEYAMTRGMTRGM